MKLNPKSYLERWCYTLFIRLPWLVKSVKIPSVITPRFKKYFVQKPAVQFPFSSALFGFKKYNFILTIVFFSLTIQAEKLDAFDINWNSTYEPNYKIEPLITPEDQEIIDKVSTLIPGRIELAYEILNSNIRNRPSAPLCFIAGTLSLQIGKVDNSILFLEKALELFPHFQRASKNLGLAYLQSDDFDNALKNLQKSLELGSNDSVIYSAIGFCYLQKDKLSSAENAYRMALVRDAESLNIRKGLITALSGQGRSKEAISLIDEILYDSPRNREFWTSRISSLSNIGDKTEMLIAYECLVRVMEPRPVELLRMGDLFLSLNLPTKALKYYQNSLLEGGIEPSLAIRSIKRLASYGFIQEATKLANSTQTEYNDYLNDSEIQSIQLIQAKNLIENNLIQSARELLERLLQKNAMDGEVLLLLAQIHKSEDTTLAISYLERARKIDTFTDKASLELGRIYSDRRDWAKSLYYLRSIETIDKFKGLQRYISAIERMRGF